MTSRRAFAEGERQRRQAAGRRRRQALIGLVAVAVTTLTVVAVAMDRLLRPGAFPIKELRLEGEFVHLHPDTVRAAVVGELGDNYFSLDLGRIETVVEALSWVHRAKVRRSWPHGLTVRVEEQRPVARWGEKNWLNEDAEIVQLEQVVATDDLVLLHGPDLSAAEVWTRYNQWRPLLRDVGLHIESITVNERFAWSLRLRAGASGGSFRVLLGVGGHDPRMRRLTSSYKGVQQQTGSLLSIDLRYPNGMAIARHDATPNDAVALNEVD